MTSFMPHHFVVMVTCLCFCAATFWLSDAIRADQTNLKPASRDDEWSRLFDGKTLQSWKVTRFGGEGDVYVQNQRIVLDFGGSLTGITYQKNVPKLDYEISLDAMRVDGTDFFCGLTFPVDDAHCSLIVGGWGGALVGISSIDGKDASENETQLIKAFKTGQWYTIRVRVTREAITAWIGGKRVIRQEIKGHRLSTRPEVDLSKPLGICSWETRAAIRNIRLRKLRPDTTTSRP